jgi:ADP-heptose:LPS heptosyltransferase
VANTVIPSSQWNNLYANVFDAGRELFGRFDEVTFSRYLPLFNAIKLPGNYVAFCVGASSSIRNIAVPEAVELILYLLGLGKRVHVFYDNLHAHFVTELRSTKSLKNIKMLRFFNLSFESYFRKLVKYKYVISMDSSAAHIGMAANSEVYVIYGPTNSRRILPSLANVHPISTKKNLDCMPCEEEKCRNNEYKACMKDLNYREIFSFD